VFTVLIARLLGLFDLSQVYKAQGPTIEQEDGLDNLVRATEARASVNPAELRRDLSPATLRIFSEAESSPTSLRTLMPSKSMKNLNGEPRTLSVGSYSPAARVE